MNQTSEILKRIGFAIVLGSLWLSYSIVLEILAGIVIVTLMLSCIVLKFRERLSQSRWKKLVELSDFDVTFAALALTMFLSGAHLVNSGLEDEVLAGVIVGVLIILAGCFFLGNVFGHSVSQIISELRHRKSKAQSTGKYVGSIGRYNYHYPTCSAVKKILPENLIWFGSAVNAQSIGYSPCGICKPPLNN